MRSSCVPVDPVIATIVYALTGKPPAPGPEIEWEGVSPELAKQIKAFLVEQLQR